MVNITDPEFLTAALAGYKKQLSEIETKMAELRQRLDGKLAAPGSTPPATPGANRNRLSDEARRRIAAAQRKRWAKVRKAAASSK